MVSNDSRIERSTLDQLVVDRIIRWLKEKRMGRGDRLPSEQALSEELGICRHALREGLKRLAQLGVLETRSGVGTSIRQDPPDSFSDLLNPILLIGEVSESDIVEVREAVESYAARLAAERADEEHMNALEALIGEMEAAIDDYETFVKKNVEFHLMLGKASGNRLLAQTVNTFREILNEWILSVPVFPGSLKNSVEGHRRVLAAIRARDPDRAAAALSCHLREVNSRFTSTGTSGPADGASGD